MAGRVFFTEDDFELKAIRWAGANPTFDISLTMAASQAISLKRIADALEHVALQLKAANKGAGHVGL